MFSRVFLNTTELPVHPSGDEDREVKADFGLFLGDAGVSRDDFFVSQRMTLTGARKLPRGTKMKAMSALSVGFYFKRH